VGQIVHQGGGYGKSLRYTIERQAAYCSDPFDAEVISMPITEKEFKIGLMVTALLEDRYNKTGHMREEARKAANR
jgi:hypothetical protein